MTEFDESNLTNAVLGSLAQARSPRIKQISEALVRHLHGFIREVEPTEQEWSEGIAFLTRTGQMCSDTRQEFILLSDVLGASMLVDAINHRLPGDATATTVLGPFYVEPPDYACGEDISPGIEGFPLHISGKVRSTTGESLRDAVVDIWHSDPDGFYDLQLLDRNPGLSARGRFRTASDGSFHFWTIRPSPYPIPDDGPVGAMLAAQGRHPYRPEHVHFRIEKEGYRTLVTHLFADGGDYLDSDVVFGVKESLVQAYQEHVGGQAPDGRAMEGRWYSLHHDFVLLSS
jgi:hydroxyquinol 1,2-dioxygenase